VSTVHGHVAVVVVDIVAHHEQSVGTVVHPPLCGLHHERVGPTAGQLIEAFTGGTDGHVGFGTLSLDLGADHEPTNVWFATDQEVVRVGSLGVPAGDADEVVNVELALEALVLRLIEVLGHNVGLKSLLVVNLEGSSVHSPRDNVGESLLLGIFQDVV